MPRKCSYDEGFRVSQFLCVSNCLRDDDGFAEKCHHTVDSGDFSVIFGYYRKWYKVGRVNVVTVRDSAFRGFRVFRDVYEMMTDLPKTVITR